MKDLPAPCAACKLLRRRCVRDRIYAPYFPAEDPLKFASVHKIFGASNINKMLKELPEHQRNDAVSSMVYEANARVRDPVYGCVGAISCLQKELVRLRAELVEVNKEIIRLRSENAYEEGAEICCYGDLQNWSPDSPGVDMDLFAGPSGLNSDSSSNVFEQCFG